ncbi:hypothetical protein ACFV1L_21965 [Kitasatospora sp. NPDC059646]|uniref:hypothetical protein n=1 Tax=Kitasatospora sp. NPDC059646 TaxID=3346893 RepID=UPI003684FDDA
MMAALAERRRDTLRRTAEILAASGFPDDPLPGAEQLAELHAASLTVWMRLPHQFDRALAAALSDGRPHLAEPAPDYPAAQAIRPAAERAPASLSRHASTEEQ